MFGWTADREESFAVLDAYSAAGGNFVDTADVYTAFAPGNSGGESEQVLGEWLRARGNRDDVVIATKVGLWDQRPGLSAANITAAAEDSLRRLGVEHIDLYYAHRDDADAPLEETLTAFDGLVRSGKVRHIAASNYSPARLQEALAVSRSGGLVEFAALQPHYNLVERADFEDSGAAELVQREGLGALPYYALAKGFLTGKYRPGDDTSDSPRADGARAYLDERGVQVLAALDEIALVRGVPVASVALAWLCGKPGVTAPIASARNTDQLQPLLTAGDIELSAAEMRRLDDASS